MISSLLITPRTLLMSCFRERRKGCRKRKSVRGCIVGPDLATMSLVIIKKGAEDVPGLTRHVRLTALRAVNATWRSSLCINKMNKRTSKMNNRNEGNKI